MADARNPQREYEIDWEHMRRKLRERVRSQLGPCDAATLDDLTQEALVDVLRSARRDGVRNLAGLLTVVARSVAINEIRRRRRERLRRVDWDEHLDRIVELPAAHAEDSDDSYRVLWFLLLEYFRANGAACHRLACIYAEVGDWRQAADHLGLTHDAVRQQWSRCARKFVAALRRDPGPFKDWLGDV